MYNSKRTYEAEIVSRFLADHNGGRIGSGGGVEFQHVAVFDKINLIESTKKFAGVQRGLPPPPPLFFFFFAFTVRLSKQTPKIRVSAHRHKEIYSLPSPYNFAIPRNYYWWHNKFLSSALRIFNFRPSTPITGPSGTCVSSTSLLFLSQSLLLFFSLTRFFPSSLKENLVFSGEIQICPGVFEKGRRGRRTRKKCSGDEARKRKCSQRPGESFIRVVRSASPATESFFRWPLCSPLPAHCEPCPLRFPFLAVFVSLLGDYWEETLDLWITRDSVFFNY